MNLINRIEKKLKYLLKTIVLIILLLTFNYIPILLFNIDFNSMSLTNKILYYIIMDIVLITIFYLIYKKDITKDFKNFFNKKFFNNLKEPLKYWILGLIIMIISNYLIIILANNTISQNEQAVRELINKAPLFMMFETLIYAPITEEIIFRKSLKDIFNNKYIYAIASGILFGLTHIIGSINTTKELLFIIPYGAVGFTFALCYKKTNNIFSTISAHTMHNGLTLLLYFLGKLI